MGTENATRLVSTGGGGGNPQSDEKLQLYKLEYERAAIRYDNIYSALWQIFSYMSAISGALLAFGGDRFQEKVFWVLALSPLVFWYWCSFEPLNRYGTNCGTRLAQIEDTLNKLYVVQMDHYLAFGRRTNEGKPQRHRVQFRVRLVFRSLSAIWLFLFVLVGWSAVTGHSLRRDKPTEVKIVTVNAAELKKLLGSENQGDKTALPSTVQSPKSH